MQYTDQFYKTSGQRNNSQKNGNYAACGQELTHLGILEELLFVLLDRKGGDFIYAYGINISVGNDYIAHRYILCIAPNSLKNIV